MADSLNTQLADALTADQLDVLRVEIAHRQDVWALLGLLEADVLQSLKIADPTEPLLLAWRRRRVTQVMTEEIAPLVQSRYAQIAAQTTAFLVLIAQHSAEAVRRIVNRLTERETLPDAVPLPALRQRVTETLFPSGATTTDLSATGTDWWTRLRDSLTQRLGDQALISVSLGESLAALLARVRGTAALGHTDGVMAKAKQEARRVLRTAVTHAVSTARTAMAETNAESGMVLQHSSIIDSLTSTICLRRNGLRFAAEAPHEPLGHSIPYLFGCPYHPNCRSTFITVLRDGGPVAGGNVDTFLRRQSVARQQEMLGPGRWQLWTAGTLNIRDLLEASTGRPLTLEELGA